MAEQTEPRVAVYIDFDNIVISQYDNVHGRGLFIKEKARTGTGKTAEKLQAADVNIGAVLDYASSFGAVAISRAYADWAAPANNRYQKQLVQGAVDLVQLFNTSGTKNGADIRLAIDVVEDLFRLPDITHIVIVAGDSDYIPLAQSARRLGRTVIGIGVAGSTSASFKNACDEFSFYQDLPGIEAEADTEPDPEPQPTQAKATSAVTAAPLETPAGDPKKQARKLLRRALQVSPGGDDGWTAASGLKTQMKRLDAGFDEKKIDYKSFTDFLKAEGSLVELREDGQLRWVRLRERD
ncbi:MAG: NYN domain-containing protein [Pseudolysinimonas sp.]